MRILLVHNTYQQKSGEDFGVQSEIAQLRALGHEVQIYTAHNESIRSVWDKIRASLQVCYNWQARKDVAGLIQSFRPDIMHVHNFFPLISPSVFDAAVAADVPSVFTLANFRILCPTVYLFHDGHICERSLTGHSWWTVPLRTYKNSFLGTLALAAMVEFHKWRGTWQTKVDRFLVPTRFAKSKFVEGGLPADRITIRPHGLPESKILPKPPDGPRAGALYIGRLSEEKGIVRLARLWKDVGTTLTIIGDGPLRAELQALASPDLRVLGFVDAETKQAELARAAFLVMPTIWNEMFGLTIVEAYAAALPVVASRRGGPAETVEEGVTGLLFDPDQPPEMLASMRWAAANADAMRIMGDNARARYESDYTPAANMANLMAIYQELIEPQPKILD